jgi:hypothetical protein
MCADRRRTTTFVAQPRDVLLLAPNPLPINVIGDRH